MNLFKRPPILLCLTTVLFFYTTCQPEDIEHNNVIIAKFPFDKDCAISFTFDDGCASCQTEIVPLFNQYKYKATFFVITDQVKDWSVWKNLNDQGFEIGNHTADHLILGNVYDSAVINHQINDSYRAILNNVGVPPVSFAHPGHSTNSRVDSVVFENHLFSRLSPKGFCGWHGWTSYTSEKLVRQEISNAIEKNRWYVPAAHGIDDCWEPITKTFLTNILEYIKRHDESIVVETFKNIALYRAEKANTTIRVNDSPNQKTIQLDCSLPADIYNYPLTILVKNYKFPGDANVSSRNDGLIQVRYRAGDMQLIVKPNAIVDIKWK